MGNVTSRVVNHITRPFREYNLQERAHKAAIRNRDVASPRHVTTDLLIKESIELLPPEVKEDLTKPDEGLNSMLRQVYVSSHDVIPEEPLTSSNPDRPLPQSRQHFANPEFGYSEPKVVPYGRVTLKAAVQFIAKHLEDPEQHSAQAIALSHKLDRTLTENVLKHFGTFRLLVPAEPSPKQVEMLKKIDSSPSFLSNNPQVQKMLSGVAMKDPTAGSDKIPMTSVKGPTVQVDDTFDPYPKVTLMDPYPLGMEKKGDKDGALNYKDKGMEVYFQGNEPTASSADTAVPVENADKPLVNDSNQMINTQPVALGEIPLRSAKRAKRTVNKGESDEKNTVADAT